MEHVVKRKVAFDKKVLLHKPGEVIFLLGQLVQIYRSDLDYTFKTDRKLLPKWSPPQRVASRTLNSYTLERLNGTPIAGHFSTRRLRRFIPKEETKLADKQAEFERRMAERETHGVDENRIEEGSAERGVEADEDRLGGDATAGGEDAAILEGGHMEYRASGPLSTIVSRDTPHD